MLEPAADLPDSDVTLTNILLLIIWLLNEHSQVYVGTDVFVTTVVLIEINLHFRLSKNIC